MVSPSSPFPGMDPYLESKWPEVHARLIVYAANQLNAQLPEDLHLSPDASRPFRDLSGSAARAVAEYRGSATARRARRGAATPGVDRRLLPGWPLLAD